ncbi:MAG: thiolase family protein [Dehalococcoidia bacterium]
MTGKPDATAIVGVGNTSFADLYRNLDRDRSAFALGAEAFVAALADSGLAKDEIDGVLVCRIPDYARMCDILGIRYPRFVNVMAAEGRQASLTVQYASMAIQAGLANTVACIYGNNGRSVGARYGGEGGGGSDSGISDAAYGMTSPGASVAHMFRRHQYLYGTPAETLGHIAINSRLNAALNPNAVMRDPLTMDQYMASRFIAEPLRLNDYCLINDGAVCLIVTSAERAKDLRKPPVYLHASAVAGDFDHQYTVDDCFYGALLMIGRDLFARSGVQREDLGVAQIYDNFTPTVLFTLEGLGFCGRGESGAWVTPERIARDGELPLNTSGGHTSESYMQGWGLLAEAVRQVRGECGERQVSGCQTALYACAAPISSAMIFRR